jgi:hypothetical protein
LSSYHYKRAFWWKCQTGDRNYQVLVWYVHFPFQMFEILTDLETFFLGEANKFTIGKLVI